MQVQWWKKPEKLMPLLLLSSFSRSKDLQADKVINLQLSPLVSTSKRLCYGDELQLRYVLLNQVASKSSSLEKLDKFLYLNKSIDLCANGFIRNESPAQPAQQESWTWLQSPWSSWGQLGRTSLQRDVVTLVGRTQIFEVVK